MKTKNNPTAYVVYHRADFDGLFSGVIAQMHLMQNEGYKRDEVVMIGHDYHDDHEALMENLDDPNAEVIMLDFCLPMPLMEQLNAKNQFTWIDHHQQENELIPGIRQIGTAACRLAWQYFFEPAKEPEMVRLAGLYDVWDKTDENWDIILMFQYGLRTLDLDPQKNDSLYHLIKKDRKDDVEEVISSGGLILTYQEEVSLAVSKHAHVERVGPFEKVLCLNTGQSGSMQLEHLFDPEEHDFMMVYQWTGNGHCWKVSGYHSDAEAYGINIGAYFAAEYGGGGHAGAAGCQMQQLPWHQLQAEVERAGDEEG